MAPRNTTHLPTPGPKRALEKWREEHKMQAYKLTQERVEQRVPQKQPGFYRLGDQIGGQFYTSYVGRSDNCLQTRLQQHANKKFHDYFIARPLESREAAHRLECLFYHLEQDQIDNIRHPPQPAGTQIGCPYCEFESRLSAVSAENNRLYVHKNDN